MFYDDQESCTSSTSQDFGQATSINISPRAPSILFPINMLFDEVLLQIFAFYVEECYVEEYPVSAGAWHNLACVCRRWRSIALGSPRRLNLRIICSERIPVRENLEFWPPFPIVLTVDHYLNSFVGDNILATLEHHDRVCQIAIWIVSSSQWEKVLFLMQKPFPILTDLTIRYWYDRIRDGGSEIPDSFLGGYAPRLRKLHLEHISFPGWPKLLLSATDLVHLELHQIPMYGYISAEVITTCLSTLTKLESLSLLFRSPRHLRESERRRTSSSTRHLLPALTCFQFKGASEYLEDIVEGIDAPLLDTLRIRFPDQPIFDTPRLTQFIGRLPELETCNEASLRLDHWHASVKVLSLSKTTTNASLLLEAYDPQDVQLSLVQLCTSSLPQALIPTVERLNIVGSDFSRPPVHGVVTGPDLWGGILRPFTAVKDLYLSPKIAPHIALVLQDLVGGDLMELLPALQNIFLKEPQPPGLVPEGIEQFVAARQLASYPISVSRSEIEASLTW
jgi:hypothetical protein